MYYILIKTLNQPYFIISEPQGPDGKGSVPFSFGLDSDKEREDQCLQNSSNAKVHEGLKGLFRPVCVFQTRLPETKVVPRLSVQGPLVWLWRYGGPLRGEWKTWKPHEESISGSSVGGSPLIWCYRCLRGKVNRTNAIRQQRRPKNRISISSRETQSSPKHRQTHTDRDALTYTGI